MIPRIALAVAAAAVAAACVSDGRALEPPPPGATIPPSVPASVATTAGAVIGTASPFVLSSPDLVEGGPLDERFTCYGAGISPPLQWSGVPAGAVELAVFVTDENEGGLVHWVVTDLSPDLVALGLGTTPEGAVEALNGSGVPGWLAPCNDPNAEPHRFVFVLHALRAPSGIVAGTEGIDAVTEILAQSFAQAALTVLYPGGSG